MIGEEIAVLRRARAGTDDMGEAAYEWSSEAVPNCLVKPGTATADGEQSDALRPDAAEVTATVALPSDYTDGKPFGYFANARVALTARGMDADDHEKALRVVGDPLRTDPCPTSWDTLLTLTRAEG